VRPASGAAAIGVGVAHFVAPAIFEPFNRLGFPQHARAFTYLNGAIETTIGVLTVIPRARRQATVLSLCYLTYLAISIVGTQVRLQHTLSRGVRPAGQ
jgi:uncharacterized membrane protein